MTYCGGVPDLASEGAYLDYAGLLGDPIAGTVTRAGWQPSNGIFERLHRTLLDEHLRVQGRTVWYEMVEEMQKSLDGYLVRYNTERPHQGRGISGSTSLQSFI